MRSGWVVARWNLIHPTKNSLREGRLDQFQGWELTGPLAPSVGDFECHRRLKKLAQLRYVLQLDIPRIGYADPKSHCAVTGVTAERVLLR